jgi:hypothetical protein
MKKLSKRQQYLNKIEEKRLQDLEDDNISDESLISDD